MKYKWYLLVSIFYILVSISLNIAKPYVLSLFFDDGIANKEYANIYLYTLIFFLIMFLSAIIAILSEYIVSKIANQFICDLRICIIEKIVLLPAKFYNDNSVGDIITRIDDDVQDIRNFVLYDIAGFIETILSFIASVMFIGLVQWKMLVSNLVIIPLLIIVMRIFKDKLYNITIATKKALSSSNKELVDGIKNLLYLKSINCEEYFVDNMKNKYDKLAEESIKSSILQTSSASIIQFVINLTYMITIGYGGILILQGEMTSGMLLAFISMRNQLLSPVKAINSIYYRYYTVKASFQRLNEIYNQEVEKGISITPVTLHSKMKISKIEITNLSYRYNKEKLVLNNMNMVINENEWIGIKGASGIGKSTFAKLLLKIIYPTDGDILINNISIAKINNSLWRERISYVSQGLYAYNQSIRE